MKNKAILILLALILTTSNSTAVFASDSNNTLSDERSRIGNNIFYYNPNDGGNSSENECVAGGVIGGSGDIGNVPDPWRSLILSVAGKYPDVDVRLVAATLWIENRGWPDYNKEWAVSSAGAAGPWQFIPSTWEYMGTDGDGDGKKDRNNPKDAVHAAFKHQIGSVEKPIIEGYTNDIQAGLSLIFKRDKKNLLSYLASYNGLGAPDGVALKDFPRKENADYVMYGYYLLATDFTETWNEADGSRSISSSAGGGGGCGSSEVGFVSTDGFAFPLGLAKKQINYLPCDKSTCHHDGTPASDMFAPVGTNVYAIEEGVIDSVKDGYDGYTGCYSIAFTGKSGWKYWLGHIKTPTVSPKKRVTPGQKLAVVGESQCAKGTDPHLHIDRGGPEKGTPGGYDGSRSTTLIPLLNRLFEELPG